MIPLGVIVVLNTPRQSCGDYNRDIKNRKLVKINRSERDYKRNRERVSR